MFLPSVIYFELFVALLFLPGFFVTLILGIKKFRFLYSFALSGALLVLTLLPFEWYGLPIARWAAWVRLEWIILAVLAAGKVLRNAKRIRAELRAYFKSRLAPARCLVPLGLAAVICGYLAYAGPYLEIPADAWEHVRRFRWLETGAMADGGFAAGASFLTCLSGRLRWYFIHTWLCRVSGLPVMDSWPVLNFVNVFVFLMAIYYFGLFLFAGLRAAAFNKMIMAAGASLFAAAGMGNMVFAYIRYYAFAPTILNYVVFLAALAAVLAWLRSRRWFGPAAWIVPILLLAAGLIHAQEALFIFFMAMALAIAETIRVVWRHARKLKVLPTPAGGHLAKEGEPLLSPSRPAGNAMRSIAGRQGQGWGRPHWTTRELKPVILAAALLIIFFAGFAALRLFRPGTWISANLIMPNVGLPPEPVSFIFKNLMLTPPATPWLRLAAYQLFVFYQVVGCWGLFVYLLFILMARRLVAIPYFAAGMIVAPFLTVFNPFLIDMMARIGQAPALYRFLYMLPLPLVGAYALHHFWSQARAARPARRAALAASILATAGLIGLLFPINAAGIYAPYSKIYTLRRIPAANDYHLYADLGKFIARYENKVILSDGWTAGFLWNFAPKNTYGWIRWLNSSSPENKQPEPYTWENLRGRGLIVVNCRDGAPSISGRISGHWREDVLKLSRLYAPEARAYLESRPEKFRKIWSQNQIAIYAVR